MTELEPSAPVPPQQSGRERINRAWTITSAVIVALIVLAAVTVIMATRGGDTTPSAGKSAPAASTPASTPPSAAASLPAQDQTVPTSGPTGVTWSLFQGVALPTSSNAGPTRVSGPVYAGYAQTPTGALLAAKQIGARHLITPGDDWRRVVQEQVVPGPGRDAFVAARERVTTDNVPPGTYGQTAGFRFVTYQPDVAVIQLVGRFSTGTLQVTTSTVRWISGDWKLQLQRDGSASPTAQRVDSLTGFIPWSGL